MNIKKEDIDKIGHRDDWKYLVSVSNALDAMKYCRVLMEQLQMDIRHEFSEYESKQRKPCIEDFPLGYMAKVGNIRVNRQFIVNMNVINFFQYASNCLDYIAQVVNAFYSAKRMEENNVSFSKISKNASNKFNSTRVAEILTNVRRNELYDYINDFNNYKKHNCDTGMRVLISNDDSLEMTGIIDGFSKKTAENEMHRYPPVNGSEKMEEVHRFINDIVNNVFSSICEDFIKEQ